MHDSRLLLHDLKIYPLVCAEELEPAAAGRQLGPQVGGGQEPAGGGRQEQTLGQVPPSLLPSHPRHQLHHRRVAGRAS